MVAVVVEAPVNNQNATQPPMPQYGAGYFSDSSIWALYVKGTGSGNEARLAISTDGGQTWAYETIYQVAGDTISSVKGKVDRSDRLHILLRLRGVGTYTGQWQIGYIRRNAGGGYTALQLVTDFNVLKRTTYSVVYSEHDGKVHVVFGTDNSWNGGQGFGSIWYTNDVDDTWPIPTAPVGTFPFLVSHPSNQNGQGVPNLMIGRNGVLHCCWWGRLSGSVFYWVSYRRHLPGQPYDVWDPIETIFKPSSAQTARGASQPSIVEDPNDGTVYVAWMEWSADAPSNSTWNLAVSSRPFSGVWTAPTYLTSRTGGSGQFQTGMSITIDKQRNVFVYWQGQGWDTNSVYNVQRIKRNFATSLWESRTPVTDFATENRLGCCVFSRHNTPLLGASVVWTDRTGTNIVYFDRLDAQFPGRGVRGPQF